MTFSDHVLDFHFNVLQPDWELPEGVDLLFPYTEEETRSCMEAFYGKYLNDTHKRHFVFGINSGRFGSGLTGVPFTGPKMLREQCGIEHNFGSRPELSAEFIWMWINEMGGAEAFFRDFYITSVCPLGFTKDGKNYNYYDSKKMERAVLPHIVANVNSQLAFGGHRDFALCLGEGKNYTFFRALNEEHGWFGEVIPLSHPRYVMQYKRKSLSEYLERFVGASLRVLEGKK